jgi:hypothetical protein
MLKLAQLAIFGLSGLAVLGAPAWAGASIASHRAVYDLTLDPSKNAAGFISADGRMAFEISGSACDGWTVNFRMVNLFRPSESNERTIDTRSTSWESGDGLQMRFSQSEFVDNVLDQEKTLSAKRPSPGSPGTGEQTKPAPKAFDIRADAIFPVQHQLKLMDAASSGKSRDASVVYDGSDENEKPYRTITFIGRTKEPGKVASPFKGAGGDKLAALPAWPVSISYFEDEKTSGSDGEQTPLYQVSFDLYANGVADQLVLNYGDFALRGKLQQLEFLDQPACQQ